MVMMKRDVGELLLQGRLITAEQLAEARQIQQQEGGDIGYILVDRGFCTKFCVCQARAHLQGLRAVDLSTIQIDTSAVNVVPAHVAQRHKAIPLQKRGDFLIVAMAEAGNVLALDDLQAASGLRVQAVLALPEQIDQAIEQHYGQVAEAAPAPGGMQLEVGGGIGGIQQALAEYQPIGGISEDAGPLSDEQLAQQAPIIRIAHMLIQNAILEGASDIHVEPAVRNLRVRYRIDGVLHEVLTLPRHIHAPLSSRYKIMSDMNIAERRLPQDGRIGITFQGKDFDMRVSCIPTMLGEKIVMRILDKSSVMIGMTKLGFFPDTMANLEELITQPYGMLLSTGPTGAGKTTTQYSVLHRINTVDVNILTIEDPIEYQLPGVSQVQVHRKAGLTFANALRSFMRQDPDIMMVGEIRDLETAEMAIQSSLTGHLVLSTLHTNDAPSAITRLVDMGVEPFLISATLIGVMAQRLARTICPQCKEAYELDADELRRFGWEPEGTGQKKVQLWRGRGCENCRNKGYRGRVGIFELMRINDEIAELIVRRAPVAEIREAARANGMRTLREDGLRKVLAGVTTPEEVRRVVFTIGY
ncbi:MAG: Flp pilus assembly complex ATPase component TadA [Armatimonadetes bacterium]|nr:Flp pilus assembly complex ATPase component TadA [Armatimonadota bacterium]